MTIDEIKLEIIAEFNVFDDWMDRYDYLIGQCKKMKPLNEQYKTEDNLIEGCQSRVWLHAFLNEKGQVVFDADSDTIITKGMIALLIRVFSNQKPSDILNADINFLDQIGLKEQLSPNRSNGLMAMVKQLKLYALAYDSKYSKA